MLQTSTLPNPELMNKILIISANWIGDVIMSMPAVQIFRKENPAAKIIVLTKPRLKALWEMSPAIDQIQSSKFSKGNSVIQTLRSQRIDRAYIFPNSFRSAFIPFLAGIPERIGSHGHWRRLMLTKIVHLTSGHQQFESMNILGVQGEPSIPRLNVPTENFQTLKKKLWTLPTPKKNKTLLFQALENEHPTKSRPIITLLPGAARGPSKRWPPGHFTLLAKKLHSSLDALVLLSGDADDIAICQDIADTAEESVIQLAGQTTLSEWAALLKISDCVVANDSGGMHLASAVGTPVAAIFGQTDPKKTGPLGLNLVLQKSEIQRRDIARDSEQALHALSAVKPSQLFRAVQKLLNSTDRA